MQILRVVVGIISWVGIMCYRWICMCIYVITSIDDDSNGTATLVAAAESLPVPA